MLKFSENILNGYYNFCTPIPLSQHSQFVPILALPAFWLLLVICYFTEMFFVFTFCGTFLYHSHSVSYYSKYIAEVCDILMIYMQIVMDLLIVKTFSVYKQQKSYHLCYVTSAESFTFIANSSYKIGGVYIWNCILGHWLFEKQSHNHTLEKT